VRHVPRDRRAKPAKSTQSGAGRSLAGNSIVNHARSMQGLVYVRKNHTHTHTRTASQIITDVCALVLATSHSIETRVDQYRQDGVYDETPTIGALRYLVYSALLCNGTSRKSVHDRLTPLFSRAAVLVESLCLAPAHFFLFLFLFRRRDW